MGITAIVKCKKKLNETERYNSVGWVDKPNVSDSLWICWVYNPTYPLIFEWVSPLFNTVNSYHKAPIGAIFLYLS